MLGLERITFDPKIMAGQACIRSMRVPVSLVLNLIANGKTDSEILEDYPYLEPEDIKQSLQYAAWLSREKVIPFSCADR
jgi:uncharacterized protein (DUF433 family)